MKSQKLYSTKQIWKIILSVVALIIIGLSLWYTNFIAEKIQNEEKLRVKLWSQTIKKQAQLVNLTNQTFEQLKAEERDNIKDWIFANDEINNREFLDYTFVSYFTQKERNFSSIVETINNKNGKITSEFNIDNRFTGKKKTEKELQAQDSLKKITKVWDTYNKPIKIESRLSSFTQIIHYGNSKLFSELKLKSDSLITSFENELILNSASIPIIYLDSATKKIKRSINIESEKLVDSTTVSKTVYKMANQNEKIKISFGEGNTGYIYYSESNLLKQLRYFPWIQITIILLFLMVSYFLFSTFRKAEQNQVWAGMAKETAHQLGTPLSSLMAWLEIIKADGVPETSIDEMNKDILRLNTITERFSKIGSETKTTKQNIYSAVQNSTNYLKSRVSQRVDLTLEGDKNARANINISLFEWVIENLTKNAIDAIHGKEGSVNFNIQKLPTKVYIDITDTGKGIPSSNFKKIFQPGFSTKERGWGLGLSLVKRIVEEQLNGKIYVLSSKIDQGTTFRIVLKK